MEGACFLCGDSNPLTSTPPSSQYLHEIKVFKTYFSKEEADGGGNVETCANCAQDVTSVWRLHLQILALRRDIDTIVERTPQPPPKKNQGGDQNVAKPKKNVANPLGDFEPIQIYKEEIDCSDLEEEDFLEKEPHPFETRLKIKIEDEPVKSSLTLQLLDDPEEERFPGQVDPDPVVPSPKIKLHRPKKTTTIGRDPLALSDPESEDSDPDFVPPSSARPKRRRKSPHKIPCPQCDTICEGKQALDDHTDAAHTPKDKSKDQPHKCAQCGKSFQSRTSLVNHAQRSHPKLRCSTCATEFVAMKAWAVHEATVCAVPGWDLIKLKDAFNVTLVPCPLPGCGQLFDREDRSLINRHISTHQNTVCNPGSSDLLGNDEASTGSQSYNLSQAKTSKTKAGRKKKGNSSKEYNYKCTKCPMMYRKPSQLEKHLELHDTFDVG